MQCESATTPFSLLKGEGGEHKVTQPLLTAGLGARDTRRRCSWRHESHSPGPGVISEDQQAIPQQQTQSHFRLVGDVLWVQNVLAFFTS